MFIVPPISYTELLDLAAILEGLYADVKAIQLDIRGIIHNYMKKISEPWNLWKLGDEDDEKSVQEEES